MMNHQEFELKTFDHLKLFCQIWEPIDSPKGVVSLVHGLGEHSGRYVDFATRLNQANFAVTAFDLRGHGQSEGLRGHIPSFNACMEDISTILDETFARFPSQPVFLYGHSLGGVLVLSFALRKDANLAGVVAAGSGLRSSIAEDKRKVILSQIGGSLFPRLAIPSGLDLNMVSRDPEIVKKLQADPLRNDQITLAFGKHMLAAFDWLWEHANQFSYPLLLMHGTADQLAYPSGSQAFAEKVSDNCTLKLWEGLSHELHNEPEKEQVFTYLVDWLNGILDRSA
jgi:acylglycerol lipase